MLAGHLAKETANRVAAEQLNADQARQIEALKGINCLSCMLGLRMVLLGKRMRYRIQHANCISVC